LIIPGRLGNLGRNSECIETTGGLANRIVSRFKVASESLSLFSRDSHPVDSSLSSNNSDDFRSCSARLFVGETSLLVPWNVERLIYARAPLSAPR
jgi:hypothetical protein